MLQGSVLENRRRVWKVLEAVGNIRMISGIL
nr:MAG TPA: hypothetical protein [Caudoviricetes sp.]